MTHRYEIWDVSSLGHGENLQPLFMYEAYSEFATAYIEYAKRCQRTPCVIMCKYLDNKEEEAKKHD